MSGLLRPARRRRARNDGRMEDIGTCTIARTLTMKNLTYTERAALSAHPLSKKLFLLMDQKQTNLGLAVDVTLSKTLIDLIHAAGPHICVLKTHIDILSDYYENLMF